MADPALLERVVANLVDNALAWSPPDQPVRVCGGAVNQRVDLRHRRPRPRRRAG
jgi:two-component system sensor histidine kinase KdpD